MYHSLSLQQHRLFQETPQISGFTHEFVSLWEAMLVESPFGHFFFKKRKGEDDMEKLEVGEIFTISDENDQEQEVEVLGTLNIEGTEYAAVGFVEDLQNEAEENADIDVFFLKIDHEGDLAFIENDEEFDKVSNAFDEVMGEED